jgi:hypothetical protein
LRKEFIDSGFDTRHVIRLICKSRTYQLSVKTNSLNDDDSINYSHAIARRLPAEVLFDAIHVTTGSQLNIPGVPAGTRAAALPDSGVTLPSGFLATLGRPSRESACECERANDLQLGSVLALVSGPDLSRAIGDSNNAIAKMVAADADNRKIVDQLYMRILNRHSTDAEVDLAIDSFEQISKDHTELVKQRDERKAIAAAARPKLEQERQAAIAAVTSKLDETIAQLDPELLAKEAARKTAIDTATKAVADYEKSAGGFTVWQQKQLSEIQWHPLVVSRLESTVQRPYAVRADRSVLLEAKPGKDIYTAYSATDLSGVSAVRLEFLADETLSGKGPGFANGNLVLTEFEIEVAHPEHPDVWEKVPIASGLANFEQQNFVIAQAIDGKIGNQQGWALAGAAGKTSWATFQLKMPIGYSHGTLLRFKLHQSYDDQHQIGCFRISLTKYHRDSGLGLSESLLAELAKPEAKRTAEIKAELTKLFKTGDPELTRLRNELAAASKPLPVDPKIVQLREQLARVSQPVPPDPLLVQLEKDVVLSATQLENNRLTAAQDLAWALINSPSFLFNR